MRLALTVLLVSLFLVPTVGLAHDRDGCSRNDNGFLDDCDVDWDKDSGRLTITSEDDEEQIVEITKKYELFVNGDKVELDRGQKELVRDYYKHMKKLHVMAEEIGEEAAVLGEWAGKIAGDAIRKVCSRILDADDEVELDELEEAIEEDTEKIEKAAEKIEEKAEKLEEVAENLEELHYEMKEAVPELKKLDWF